MMEGFFLDRFPEGVHQGKYQRQTFQWPTLELAWKSCL